MSTDLSNPLVVLHDQPKRLPTDPLSEQEAVFVANYNGPGTGVEAYLAAFPRAKRTTAQVNACRMLERANVRAHVAANLERKLWSAEITADRILREEAAIAFSSAANLMDALGVIPPHELPDKVARAVKSFKYKRRTFYDKEGQPSHHEDEWVYSFWDKGAALRRLEEICKMVDNTGDGIRDGLESLAGALNRALDAKYRKQVLGVDK
jgi:predicted ATPase